MTLLKGKPWNKFRSKVVAMAIAYNELVKGVLLGRLKYLVNLNCALATCSMSLTSSNS